MSLNKRLFRSRGGKRAGFTLIEVLVAMSIFAFLAAGAQQVLNQM